MASSRSVHAACPNELAIAWARKDAAFEAAKADPSDAKKRLTYKRCLAALDEMLTLFINLVRNRSRVESATLSHSVASHETEFTHFCKTAHDYWIALESARTGIASRNAVGLAAANFAHANANMQRGLAMRRAAFEDAAERELREVTGDILLDWEAAAMGCRAFLASSVGQVPLPS